MSGIFSSHFFGVFIFLVTIFDARQKDKPIEVTKWVKWTEGTVMLGDFLSFVPMIIFHEVPNPYPSVTK